MYIVLKSFKCRPVAQEQHENELARSFEKFTIPSEEEGFQETLRE